MWNRHNIFGNNILLIAIKFYTKWETLKNFHLFCKPTNYVKTLWVALVGCQDYIRILIYPIYYKLDSVNATNVANLAIMAYISTLILYLIGLRPLQALKSIPNECCLLIDLIWCILVVFFRSFFHLDFCLTIAHPKS